MELSYKPSFFRKFKKLPSALQQEVRQKMESFRDPKNHQALNVHKLHGDLRGRMSFSVNYRYRIVFQWEKLNESAVLITVGDHSLYD